MPFANAEALMRALLAANKSNDVRKILDEIGDHQNVELDTPFGPFGFTVIRVLNLSEQYKEDCYGYLCLKGSSGTISVPSCQIDEPLVLYPQHTGMKRHSASAISIETNVRCARIYGPQHNPTGDTHGILAFDMAERLRQGPVHPRPDGPRAEDTRLRLADQESSSLRRASAPVEGNSAACQQGRTLQLCERVARRFHLHADVCGDRARKPLPHNKYEKALDRPRP